MVRIAFLLLAHSRPDEVIAKACALAAQGDAVAVHYDARAPRAEHDRLAAALADHPAVALARPLACDWGGWSLVRASLRLMRLARRRFGGVTHHALISGDCYPIRSRAAIAAELAARPDTDFIESVDFHRSGWIKTGPSWERLAYRHWFAERRHPRLFRAQLAVQRRLGLRRAPPAGVEMRIGSQWWLLRAATVERLLALIAAERALVRFFRRTWIPDECFFQTLVARLVPADEIAGHPPTHLAFSDYGQPVVFHDDHREHLLTRDRFFARKIAPGAGRLREALLAEFASGRPAPDASGGNGLYDFLRARGRVGLRHAPRFWERAVSLPPGTPLRAVVAADRVAAARLAAAAAARIGLPALGHLFDDGAPLGLPLGNLDASLAKRERHRRAFLRLVLEAAGAEGAVLCLDPGRADVAADLAASGAEFRLLLLAGAPDPATLLRRAGRQGLLGPASGPAERAAVLAALAAEAEAQEAALRRAAAGCLHLLAPGRGAEAALRVLSAFLDLPEPRVRPLLGLLGAGLPGPACKSPGATAEYAPHRQAGGDHELQL